MRRIVLAAVAVLVLLVVADRVAAAVAAHELASRIRADQGLTATPDVSFGGFPFLTQAVAGRYDDVSATARNVRRGGVPIATLRVHLRGVHVPLSGALHGHLGRVPVDRADGTVLLSYADVNGFLSGRGITVSPGTDGTLRVTGRLSAGGLSVSLSGDGRLATDRDRVRVVVGDVHADSPIGGVDLGGRLDVTLPLPSLPFGVALTDAHASAGGITVGATARDVVVRAPGS